MCYDFSAGNINNQLYTYVNTTQKKFGTSSYVSASTSEAKNGCLELGYVTTSDYIKITQRVYTDISTLSFSIKKANKIDSAPDTRYEGKNPNNYVWFNNEYWRIVGVFNNNTHGQNGKRLVKIIRNEVVDSLAWHKETGNNWKIASLNLLLNGAYYNSQDGSNSGYCIARGTSAIASCDYTIKGIQSNYRGMIASVTWHLGGYSSTVGTSKATADIFYEYERGTTVYSGRPTTTTGYIGLMYISDYAYSVLSSSCARTTNLSSYNSATCAGQSWLYGKGLEWTLVHDSSNNYGVFHLNEDGTLSVTGTVFGFSFRPVLYLDSSVYIIDGDGSLDKPYIIAD